MLKNSPMTILCESCLSRWVISANKNDNVCLIVVKCHTEIIWFSMVRLVWHAPLRWLDSLHWDQKMFQHPSYSCSLLIYPAKMIRFSSVRSKTNPKIHSYSFSLLIYHAQMIRLSLVRSQNNSQYPFLFIFFANIPC